MKSEVLAEFTDISSYANELKKYIFKAKEDNSSFLLLAWEVLGVCFCV